jgi:aryl-alcohol dehydrogenase-like predicted oxidoreductase
MHKRRVGPFEVSAIGLGCMSLSQAYGPAPPRDQAERVLRGALDAGHTFFDTAAVYGLGHNERLVGEVLRDHRDDPRRGTRPERRAGAAETDLR